LPAVAVYKAQKPNINPGSLFYAFILSIPSLFPVVGLEHELAPAVEYFELKLISLDGIERVKKIIPSIVVGGKSIWNGEIATAVDLNDLLNRFLASDAVSNRIPDCKRGSSIGTGINMCRILFCRTAAVSKRPAVL
jgi:hypothetical protein